MDIGTKEMLDLMAAQRNQALDQAITLAGELAVAKARIAELEKPNES
jgi:hypothetical protein